MIKQGGVNESYLAFTKNVSPPGVRLLHVNSLSLPDTFPEEFEHSSIMIESASAQMQVISYRSMFGVECCHFTSRLVSLTVDRVISLSLTFEKSK